MSEQIETFICYVDWAESFKYLSTEQKARLLDLMFNFAATGECPEVEDAALNIVFGTIRRSIETNHRKYLETVEKRRIAGRRGGQARKQMQASESNCFSGQANEAYTCSFSDTFSDSVHDDGDCGRGSDDVPFVPPMIEEVEEYADSIGATIDAEQFEDYYEAIGWVIGNGKPMRDWKAAVRNWIKRADNF